jgi:hypothetical protein
MRRTAGPAISLGPALRLLDARAGSYPEVRPVLARTAQELWSAFGDLDTVSAFAVLRGLTLDADFPAGAKSEAFLFRRPRPRPGAAARHRA